MDVRITAAFLCALGCTGTVGDATGNAPPPPILELNCEEAPAPTRAGLRRLNAREYRRTVEALLLSEDASALALPEDAIAYGFDTVGSTLQLSPLLVESYASHAHALAEAMVAEPLEALNLRVEAEDVGAQQTGGGQVGRVQGDGTLLFISNGASSMTRQAMATGRYRVRIRAQGIVQNESPPIMAVWVDDRIVATFELSPSPEDYEAFFELEREQLGAVRVGLTNHLFRASTLPVVAGGCGACSGEFETCIRDQCRLRQPCADAGSCAADQVCESIDGALVCATPRRVRRMYLDYFDVVGPADYVPRQSPAFEAFVPCDLAEPSCVSNALQGFALRAYRRPLLEDEAQRLEALVQLARDNGDSVRAGLALAFEAILLSPHFLFRVERAVGSDPDGLLDDYALATRLAYFLWSAPPDEALLELAQRGMLRDALDAQVDRLLDDPRSRAFTEHFAGQWLQIGALENLPRAAFANWNAEVERALREETYNFFRSFLEEDKPLGELLVADYSYGDETVARFYGVAPGERLDLRRTPRRGLLGQGSILAWTGTPTRTSIVRRGKWMLDQLLCAPPPPPPPGVEGQIEEVDPDASLREQLAQHREDPACSACHDTMDNLGFALEGFDAIGRTRERDDGGFPVETYGRLADGRRFEDAESLAHLLAEDEAFAECMAQHLSVYALGRGVGSADACMLRELRLAADDGGLRGLIHAIVRHPAFTSGGVER